MVFVLMRILIKAAVLLVAGGLLQAGTDVLKLLAGGDMVCRSDGHGLGCRKRKAAGGEFPKDPAVAAEEGLKPVGTLALIYGDGRVLAGDPKDQSGAGAMLIAPGGKVVDKAGLARLRKALGAAGVRCGQAPMSGHAVCSVYR